MNSPSDSYRASPATSARSEGFLVRLGRHGQVGRLQNLDFLRLRRQERVICRTARGIEPGLVLGPVLRPGESASWDGRILRAMAAEDELLWNHLSELGEQAHEKCDRWLSENQLPAVLLDVEPMLDGKTLYFHFLNQIDTEVQDFLDSLVAIYEQEVQSSDFARLLDNGCGPGCGTSDATRGCGSSGGCAVCQVASACRK